MKPPGGYKPATPFFRDVHNFVFIKKTNCLVTATGDVGTGKSIGSVTIAYKFTKRFDMEKDIVYDVKSLLERSIESIRFKGKRLDMKMLYSVPNLYIWLKENRKHLTVIPGRAIVFDESGAGAFVRDFMKMDNRTLAKLIQIWRWLRILVIFVCPVNVNLMDSAVIKFVNLEMKFKGYPQEKGYSEFVGLKYGNWNTKKNEPYRRRVLGCRGKGTTKITNISQEFIDKYDQIGGGSKVNMILDLYKNYQPKEDKDKFTKKKAIVSVLKNTKLPTSKVAAMFDTAPAYIRQLRLQLKA